MIEPLDHAFESLALLLTSCSRRGALKRLAELRGFFLIALLGINQELCRLLLLIVDVSR